MLLYYSKTKFDHISFSMSSHSCCSSNSVKEIDHGPHAPDTASGSKLEKGEEQTAKGGLRYYVVGASIPVIPHGLLTQDSASSITQTQSAGC